MTASKLACRVDLVSHTLEVTKMEERGREEARTASCNAACQL